MKVKSSKEDPIYFDHYDPADLIKIIATQHKVTDYMKKQNYKKLYQILIIVGDFADEASLVDIQHFYILYIREVETLVLVK